MFELCTASSNNVVISVSSPISAGNISSTAPLEDNSEPATNKAGTLNGTKLSKEEKDGHPYASLRQERQRSGYDVRKVPKENLSQEPSATVKMEADWNLPVIAPLDLLDLIADEDNLQRAIRTIRSEPLKSPGIDCMTVPDICDPLLRNPDGIRALGEMLLNGSYVPSLIRRVEIPKHHGTGKRKLGIATVQDRIVQRAILNKLLEYLPDTAWNPHSYAFHCGSDVTDAIRDVNRAKEEGYQYAISIDLEAFFDNVPQERLIRKLRKHILDPRTVELIISFLKADVVLPSQKILKCQSLGTPQGSALSPYLASDLYLDELDRELTKRGHRFVRYADDCVVFCKSGHAVSRVKAHTINFLTDVMECPVNLEKTVVSLTKDLTFLGVVRKQDHWIPVDDKIHEYQHKILDILSSMLVNKSDPLMASRYVHDVATGFLGHYERIRNIDLHVIEDLRKWTDTILDKFRNNPREACSRYLKENAKLACVI